MCITFSPPTINKRDDMDMSVYVYEDDISIAIPFPENLASGFGALAAPFQTNVKISTRKINFSRKHFSFTISIIQVWVCWIFSVMLVPIIASLIIGIENGRMFSLPNISSSVFLYLEMILSRRNQYHKLYRQLLITYPLRLPRQTPIMEIELPWRIGCSSAASY